MESIANCDLLLPAFEAAVNADNAFEFNAPEEDGPERRALEAARDTLASVIAAHMAQQIVAALKAAKAAK